MRILTVFVVLAACTQDAPAPPRERALYAGQGRDRLCVAGDRAGFITYGGGDSNCSARGRLERSDTATSFRPDGDEDCTIDVRFAEGRAILGQGHPSCAYYCGPGAAFAGKSFASDASASPAVDFAGDPLC